MKKVLLLTCLIGTVFIAIVSLQDTPHNAYIHVSHLDNNWYNHNKNILQKDLENYFSLAQKDFSVPYHDTIKALVVPHAGYYYSALCAATAYQSLKTMNNEKNTIIKRVIILAPSHNTAYHGIALPDYNAYQTPLGIIDVDQEAINYLTQKPLFIDLPSAHSTEHSLEVQLPFLQSTIESFTIVPLIIGTLTHQDCLSVANELKTLFNDTTLIIVSSDFIHQGISYNYTPFTHDILNNIRSIDSQAIDAIGSQSLNQFEAILQKTGATICGQNPIRLLLALMNLNELPIHAALACYYTSAHAQKAHTAQPMNTNALLLEITDNNIHQSVSYAGIILTEHNSQSIPLDQLFTEYEKKSLLLFARMVLENYFASDKNKKPEYLLYPILSPALRLPYGAFVTLKSSTGQLRGCIGRITTQEPLYKTIHDMALAAAFNDSRFKPLTKEEFSDCSIEISILEKPQPIRSINEIIIGKHGIILKKQDPYSQITHSAVFLAKVPVEFKWTLEQTLEQLSLKAELTKNSWQKNTNFEIFTEITLAEKSGQHG